MRCTLLELTVRKTHPRCTLESIPSSCTSHWMMRTSVISLNLWYVFFISFFFHHSISNNPKFKILSEYESRFYLLRCVRLTKFIHYHQSMCKCHIKVVSVFSLFAYEHISVSVNMVNRSNGNRLEWLAERKNTPYFHAMEKCWQSND